MCKNMSTGLYHPCGHRMFSLTVPLQNYVGNSIRFVNFAKKAELKKQARFRPKWSIWLGCYFFILEACLLLVTIRFKFVLKKLIANHCNSEVDHEISHCKHKQNKR